MFKPAAKRAKNRHGRAKGAKRRLRAGRPGHPRLILEKKDVDARHKAGHDGGWFDGAEFKNAKAA
jgi:hypothetical protein